jgi:hypothetical protein
LGRADGVAAVAIPEKSSKKNETEKARIRRVTG